MRKADISAIRKRLLAAAAIVSEKSYRRGFIHGVKAAESGVTLSDGQKFAQMTYKNMHSCPKLVKRDDGKYGRIEIDPIDKSIEEFHFPQGNEFIFWLEKYEEELQKELERQVNAAQKSK